MVKKQLLKDMETLDTTFAQMVKEHKNTIYTVCFMFSKDSDEVSDLFQEVLINLWKGYSSFRHLSSMDTWIWKVSFNTCISYERKRRNGLLFRLSWTSICLRIKMKMPGKSDGCMTASIGSSHSTVPLFCCGWRISVTKK